MQSTLEEVKSAAMTLSSEHRLALAAFLLESSEGEGDPDAEAAWDREICERIREVDEGRAETVSYEEVSRRMKQRLEK